MIWVKRLSCCVKLAKSHHFQSFFIVQDPAPDQIIQLVESLFSAAAQTNERRLLVLHGDRRALQAVAESLLQAQPSRHRLWVSEPARQSDPLGISDNRFARMSAAQALKTLGREHEFIVFDGWAGLHPDAFCALAGTLVGGGLMVLLLPDPESDPQWRDPDYDRMVPYGFDSGRVTQYFVARVLKALPHCSAVTVASVVSNACGGLAAHVTKPASVIDVARTRGCSTGRVDVAAPFLPAQLQQNRLLEEMKLQSLKPPIPCVITADRGRGKSSLLGRLAAHLNLVRGMRVVVTAAVPASTENLFLWANREAKTLGYSDFGPDFMAPDALVALSMPDETSVENLIVLVDEAAMLPLTVLQRLVKKYSRIVLATTQHGYEGSGRGIAVKLYPWLDRHFPRWQLHKLTEPMRWSNTDAIEPWLAGLFGLNDDFPRHLKIEGEPEILRIPQDTLAADDELLHQVYGLLVSAHYRTTPSDLRDLLDGPNLEIWVLKWAESIGGVCLLAREGAFDDSVLCDAILNGTRRPRGHLLPQIVAFHCHSPQALQWPAARVVRIAVAPDLQGQGWGSRLLAHVEQAMQQAGVFWWGSSFALEPQVLRFWQRQGMQLLRIGASRESASGLPGALVAKLLQSRDSDKHDHVAAELSLLHRQCMFEAPLLVNAGIIPRDVLNGLGEGENQPASCENEQRIAERLQRFAQGGMPLESALGAMARWWQIKFPQPELALAAINAVQVENIPEQFGVQLDRLLRGELLLSVWLQLPGGGGRNAMIVVLRRLLSMLINRY